MKTTEEYLNILRSNKAVLMKNYPISRIGIFGSVARREHTSSSDIDIYYEGEPMGLFKLGRLKEELEALLGVTVDILRMRKQLDGSYFKEAVMKDLIFV